MHKVLWRLAVATGVALVVVFGVAAVASYGLHIRAMDSQVTAIAWAVIAMVSMRFQLPNLLNSLVNSKIGKLMSQSPQARAMTLSFVHRNLIRTLVIPLMIFVGVVALFLPAPPPPPPGYSQPALQVIAGWAFLVAFIGNELGFGGLAMLEYRAMGPWRSLKNLRRSLQVS